MLGYLRHRIMRDIKQKLRSCNMRMTHPSPMESSVDKVYGFVSSHYFRDEMRLNLHGRLFLRVIIDTNSH